MLVGYLWVSLLCIQWCRFVVKYGGHGQSGQAIKLFQITPYVNDFQTLNSPGSWQPVGASKNSYYPVPSIVDIQDFHLDDVRLAELSNNSFEWNNVTF